MRKLPIFFYGSMISTAERGQGVFTQLQNLNLNPSVVSTTLPLYRDAIFSMEIKKNNTIIDRYPGIAYDTRTDRPRPFNLKGETWTINGSDEEYLDILHTFDAIEGTSKGIFYRTVEVLHDGTPIWIYKINQATIEKLNLSPISIEPYTTFSWLDYLQSAASTSE